MTDFATQMLAGYIKQTAIPLKEISKHTNISISILRKSLNELSRSLRASEFLAICDFLKKNPNDFKEAHIT